MSQADRRIPCNGCGAALVEEADGQLRRPCPHCGHTRLVQISASDEIGISERAVAHRPPANPSDQSEGVRVAGHGNRSASADVSPESVRYDIAGDAPRNEEGALETAQILIRKLRECDSGWTDPTMVDTADVDCESRNGEDTTLSMQVTRVPRSSQFWRELGRHSSASRMGSADDLADELMNAINYKANRLSKTQRAELALVLDARDTPAFATTGTAAKFSDRHGIGAAALAFESIWVVGPTVHLVRQLA